MDELGGGYSQQLADFLQDNIGIGELLVAKAVAMAENGQQVFYAPLEDSILVFIGDSEDQIIDDLRRTVIHDRRQSGDIPGQVAQIMPDSTEV